MYSEQINSLAQLGLQKTEVFHLSLHFQLFFGLNWYTNYSRKYYNTNLKMVPKRSNPIYRRVVIAAKNWRSRPARSRMVRSVLPNARVLVSYLNSFSHFDDILSRFFLKSSNSTKKPSLRESPTYLLLQVIMPIRRRSFQT